MKQPGQPSESINQLILWAQEHADASNGAMVALPYDPEAYPAQESVVVIGNRQDAGIISSTATVARDCYPDLCKELEQDNQKNQRLTMVGEIVKDGSNVVLTTNHGDLIDVAIAHAAVATRLEHLGYAPKTGIIISKMVAFLAYKFGDTFVPCTNVLQLLEDTTFLSYPKTDSSKKRLRHRLFSDEVKRHNNKMKEAVAQTLGEAAFFSLLLQAALLTKLSPKIHAPPVSLPSGPVRWRTL